MSGAEIWMNTFRAVFLSADEKLIVGVLETICKNERREGMVAAAKIAAFHDAENSDRDPVAREIAREILQEAKP